MAVDFEVYALIIFFIAVAIWLYVFDRKKVEFKYGIAIRRWKGGLERIDRFVKRYPKFVRIIGNISAVIGIIGGIFGVGFLIYNGLQFQQGFALVLPTAGGFQFPGPVFSIPFSSWIIIIFISLTVHETMHAVYSRLEGVKVKSYGLVFLLALPVAAFVDPDNKQVQKLKSLAKFRILSSGSFSNLIIGGIVFLILIATTGVANTLFENIGVKFQSTIENTPAAAAGLSGVIQKINGEVVRNTAELSSVLDKVKPGETVTIETTEGIFELITTKNPQFSERAYIGISSVSNALKYKAIFSGVVSDSVVNSLGSWFRFLILFLAISIGIGIANLLPMKPFDGGHIFEEVFNKLFKKNAPIVIKLTAYATLFLLLFNLFGVAIIQGVI